MENNTMNSHADYAQWTVGNYTYSVSKKLILITVAIAIVGSTFVLGLFNETRSDAAPSRPAAVEGVDLFTIGDSWTAFPTHAGSTVADCVFPIYAPVFHGMPAGTCPYTPAVGYNCYGGCGLTPMENNGGMSPEGLLRDRMLARGIDITKVHKHQYALAGSTAHQWAEDYSGSSYYFTQQFKNELANPPTGKAIVWMTIGGNDFFEDGQYVDLDDDQGWLDEMAIIRGNINKMMDVMIGINPEVEIVLNGYANFKVNDGEVNVFPQTGTLGFCRELFASSTFYLSTSNDYDLSAQEWAENRWNTIDYPAVYQDYVNNWWWTTGWGNTPQQIYDAAAAYANSRKSDRIGYYNGPLSVAEGLNSYHQIYSFRGATRRINEQKINHAMQGLDTVWRDVEKAHLDNVKYFPGWTTLAIDDPYSPQPINRYASGPQSFSSDCIHLNSSGYSKWIDNILNQWLPESKYMSTRQ